MSAREGVQRNRRDAEREDLRRHHRIIEEGQEVMKEFKDVPALDAGLLAAAQAVEHYEIARYGTLKTWAGELGLNEAVNLLEMTLCEEKKTDEALTKLALSEVISTRRRLDADRKSFPPRGLSQRLRSLSAPYIECGRAASACRAQHAYSPAVGGKGEGPTIIERPSRAANGARFCDSVIRSVARAIEGCSAEQAREAFRAQSVAKHRERGHRYPAGEEPQALFKHRRRCRPIGQQAVYLVTLVRRPL
jgi:hypothetical protein